MDDLDEKLICEYLNYLKIESANDLAKYNDLWKQIYSKIKYNYEKKFINSEKYNSELIYQNKVKKTIKDNYTLFDTYLKNNNYEDDKDPQTTYRINQDIINNSRNSKENEYFITNDSNYNPKITYSYSEESSKYKEKNQYDENKVDIKNSSKNDTANYTGLGFASYMLVKNWPRLESGWRFFLVVCLIVWLLSVLDLDES